MVNPDMVNVQTACLKYAHFCDFFLVFGRFLHFKNTVKYTGIL
jgi:hypothetical protein